MAIEVTLPQLGESVVEGTITKWLVKEGDVVSKEQPLVEVATDKADSEIPSPSAGTITKIVAQAGQTVPVKSVLAILEPGEGAPKSARAPAPAAAPAPAPAPVQTQTLPAAALHPPPASAAGAGVGVPRAAEAARVSSESTVARSAFGGPLASPDVRRLAREQGIDVGQVRGSGEHGRITRDDVLRAAQPEPHAAAAAPAARGNGGNAAELQQLINAAMAEGKAVYVPPIPNVGFGAYKVPPYSEKPGDRIVPFSRRRRLTAAHMVYSKQTAPQVVTIAEGHLARLAVRPRPRQPRPLAQPVLERNCH